LQDKVSPEGVGLRDALYPVVTWGGGKGDRKTIDIFLSCGNFYRTKPLIFLTKPKVMGKDTGVI
jgi:hypothetical protein